MRRKISSPVIFIFVLKQKREKRKAKNNGIVFGVEELITSVSQHSREGFYDSVVMLKSETEKNHLLETWTAKVSERILWRDFVS